MPQKVYLKIVKMGNFMLYIFYPNKEKKYMSPGTLAVVATANNMLTFPYATREGKLTSEYLLGTRHSHSHTQKQNQNTTTQTKIKP